MTNKDLISQYVDTGIGIPEYQFDKLSNNDKKTYLRKRLIGGVVNNFEFDMLSDEQKTKYIDIVMQNHNKYSNVISVNQFEMLPDGEIKNEIRKNIINDIEGSLLAGEKLSIRNREFIKLLGI